MLNLHDIADSEVLQDEDIEVVFLRASHIAEVASNIPLYLSCSD